jgi:hypothetical protein
MTWLPLLFIRRLESQQICTEPNDDADSAPPCDNRHTSNVIVAWRQASTHVRIGRPGDPRATQLLAGRDSFTPQTSVNDIVPI